MRLLTVRSFHLVLLTLVGAACSGTASTEAPSGYITNDQAKAKPANLEPAAEVTIDTYRLQAKGLITAIDKNSSDEEVLRLADELTGSGLVMLDSMQKQFPVCEPYFDAIRAVGNTLKDLPVAEIESGYHADGKLPPMPAAECYHGKDLVVHPATVAALAKAGLKSDEDRTTAKGEILEVINHLEGIGTEKKAH